jgi:hypothetical protein
MVQAIEVVGAEVLVRDGIAQNVVGRDEETVRHGDDRFRVTAPLREVAVLGGVIGAALAGGRPRRFNERRAQPAVALAGLARVALPRTLIVPRAEAGPGRGIVAARELPHVGPELGEDLLGGPPADAWHAVEARAGVSVRRELGDDLNVEPSDPRS